MTYEETCIGLLAARALQFYAAPFNETGEAKYVAAFGIRLVDVGLQANAALSIIVLHC